MAAHRGGPEHAATRARIQNRLSEFGRLWEVPTLERNVHVSFSRRCRRALGRAHPTTGVVRLHAGLLQESAALLDEVLCHEAAHIAAYLQSGRRRIRPHGLEWQTLMRTAGYVPRVRMTLDDALARRLAAHAPPPVAWEHYCPVCDLRTIARRAVRRWRCARCLRAGRPGQLIIAKRAPGSGRSR
jgi:predicted SprT family Zn-dependent metalloprotease